MGNSLTPVSFFTMSKAKQRYAKINSITDCFPVTFRKKNKNNLFTVRKVSKYGVLSSPYFPVFGRNMVIYGVNVRIQSKNRKIRTRRNSVFGGFSRSEYISSRLLLNLNLMVGNNRNHIFIHPDAFLNFCLCNSLNFDF